MFTLFVCLFVLFILGKFGEEESDIHVHRLKDTGSKTYGCNLFQHNVLFKLKLKSSLCIE